MLGSLDELRAFIEATPRRRSPVEVHWRLTAAYVDLLFAWGYSRAPGTRSTAEALLTRAREALPTLDPIHRAVLQIFELRIREYGPTEWTPLEFEVSSLEPFDVYRLTRLLGQSAVLSRVERWRPFDNFHNSVVTSVSDEVTQLLAAERTGRTDEAKHLFDSLCHELATTDRFTGAALVGASVRRGEEKRLRLALEARAARTPNVLTSAALIAMGNTHETVPTIAALKASFPQPVECAQRFIGALALAGRRGEAEALAHDAWREATDSFATNSHFTIAAFSLCETLVLSTLRHELALGNLSQLAAAPNQSPKASHFVAHSRLTEPHPEWQTKRDAIRSLVNLTSAFERLSLSIEPARDELESMASRLAALTTRSLEGPAFEPDDLFDLYGYTWRLDRARAETEFLISQRAGAPGSWGFLFLADTATLLRDALALLRRLEVELQPLAEWMRGLQTAATRTFACLRSALVERPTLSASLQERLVALSSLRLSIPEVDSRQPSVGGEPRWDEGSFDQLVSTMSSELRSAQRLLQSPPLGAALAVKQATDWFDHASALASAVAAEA